MKIIRKIFSMVLVIAMVVSCGLYSVYAEPPAMGSITITNSENVPVTGKIFKAYKILDADNLGSEKYKYTVPDALKEFFADYFEVSDTSETFDADVVEKIVVLDAAGMQNFAKAALAEVTKSGSTITAISPDEVGGSVFSELEWGYYLVEDATSPIGENSALSTVMLDTATAAQSIVLKADLPSLTKTITDGTSDVIASNASIGDTLSYKLTSIVPDMVGYNKYFFIINDTLSGGLTLNSESFTVVVGSETLSADTDYTLIENPPTSYGDSSSFKLVFKDFINYTTGDEIVVTYTADLNEYAVVGVEGNLNSANITYSNDPNVENEGDSEYPDQPGPDDPIGETPDSNVITYTTSIQIYKTDGTNPLAGAEFQLYQSSTPIGLPQTSDGDGNLAFSGLAAGNYTIRETKAPDGYNKLTSDIEITIAFEEPDIISTGTEECTWIYTGTNDSSSNIINIENKIGSLLPGTGGIGTTIFIVLGLGLMVVAATILIVSRKGNNESDKN